MIGLTSIKVRLVGAFLAMALLASVIGAVGAHGINDVARGLSEVAGNVVPAVQGLGQVSTALEEMLLATHDALIAVSDKDLGSVRPAHDLRDVAVRQLDQAIHDFEGLPKNAQQARVWKGFTDTVGNVVRTNQEAWELLGEGDRASALKHIAGARPKRELARSALKQLAALLAEDARQKSVQGEVAAAYGRQGQGVAVGVAALAALALGFFLARGITNPLNALTSAARRLAEGDVDQSIPYNANDELGALASAMRGAIEYLKAAADVSARGSRGDFSSMVTPRCERDALSKSVIAFRQVVCAVLTETKALAAAAQAGDLQKRGDASTLEGDFQELVVEINKMLDATSAPIKEASDALSELRREEPNRAHGGRLHGRACPNEG